MTEGGLNTGGMTEGLLCLSVIPPASLSYRQSSLSFPPGLFVMPAGSPLSFPPVSPITNVGDKVSGNPGSCFVVPLFVCACMGEDLDSRLKTLDRNRRGQALGMTEGKLKASGMTECLLCLFVMPAGLLCHARWFPR